MTHTKYAFIKANWHSEIVDRSLEGFCSIIPQEQVEVFDVPGAFELPLMSDKLARTGRFDVIIAAAFVVDGGIYRHEFVAKTVVDGLMRVGLDTKVPVLSVSLTPHNYQETDDHNKFFGEHFIKKGTEAANAVLSLENTMQRVIPNPEE